jgi:hypothetical protein
MVFPFSRLESLFTTRFYNILNLMGKRALLFLMCKPLCKFWKIEISPTYYI